MKYRPGTCLLIGSTMHTVLAVHSHSTASAVVGAAMMLIAVAMLSRRDR